MWHPSGWGVRVSSEHRQCLSQIHFPWLKLAARHRLVFLRGHILCTEGNSKIIHCARTPSRTYAKFYPRQQRWMSMGKTGSHFRPLKPLYGKCLSALVSACLLGQVGMLAASSPTYCKKAGDGDVLCLLILTGEDENEY